MRIAIATTGRFHVLDLARELAALGHQVAFYSIVPRRRALRFGLQASSHRSLLPWLAPLLVAQRYGGRWVREAMNPLVLMTVDWLISWRLERCDAFIGMSGLCVKSARTARQRYGAKVFIERGSRHILSQKQILDDIKRMSPAAQTVPDYAVKRELASYELADVVVVPSRHTEKSFVERGFPTARLFRNSYGVDLSMFTPTAPPSYELPTVIFVGAWSYQKGCDLLVTAVGSLAGHVRLLHVGAVGDAPLPREDWFEHHDAAPQWLLRDWYAQAHLFVLASRQEGLSLVQAQALACGLPLVCTDRTGGEDLKDLIADPSWISVVPHDDSRAFADAISRMLPNALSLTGLRDLLGTAREQMSWTAYVRRYCLELERVLADPRSGPVT